MIQHNRSHPPAFAAYVSAALTKSCPAPPLARLSPVEAAAVAPPVARRPWAALAVLAATVLGAVISSWLAVSLGGAPPVVRPPFPLLKLVFWPRLRRCGYTPGRSPPHT